VHGVIVQLPLPPGYDVAAAQERVPPAKDVDGLHPTTQGLLAIGRPSFVPATPRGIIELLRRYQIPTSGRRAVVLGRSAIVGRPLANLLSQKAEQGNATVTLCHSRTRDLEAILAEAELLFVAMGTPEVVRGEGLKPGVVVVDVGINRVDDASAAKGYRVVGDVHFDSVCEVAGAVTPVPGGVGPMTVAGLLHNTVLAAERAAGRLAPCAT
jgi:methylenetetrahydrofolate dehydrogenase (NADP+)/methenyltetrahydrofolate cyclohydrolase